MQQELYNNLKIPKLVNVDIKGNKTTDSWMKEISLDERINFYFEFLHAFDKREDYILKNDYQTLSHRLHWHEHSYCYEFKDVTDNFNRLYYTLVFSFSNEHKL